MNKTVRLLLDSVLGHLAEVGERDQASVVLIGSVARGTQTWRSDIDIIVVVPNQIKRWSLGSNAHLHLETRDALVQKLKSRDDFVAWALRFGKVIDDKSGWWMRLRESPAAHLWPDWHLKLRPAAKRLAMADQLLSMDDLDAAEEELLTGASHIARAVLLRDHVFPLSRPELTIQLKEANNWKLASTIDSLIKGRCRKKFLRATLEDLSREIEKLSVAA